MIIILYNFKNHIFIDINERKESFVNLNIMNNCIYKIVFYFTKKRNISLKSVFYILNSNLFNI